MKFSDTMPHARRCSVALAGVVFAAVILLLPAQTLAAAAPGSGAAVSDESPPIDNPGGTGWLVGWTISKQPATSGAQHQLVFAPNLAEGPFETCGLNFRRRIQQAGQFDYQVSWGARFSCNVNMRYMKFRARLVRYQHDSDVLAYANLVNKSDARNEFSGKDTQFLNHPHLVVYVTADLGFPAPADPNNYAIGVASDPNSVNQGKSDCQRVGKTYVVHCEARSISFQ